MHERAARGVECVVVLDGWEWRNACLDRRSEAEFLEKNTFNVVFHPFDWRLNDLSNRPPDGD